MRAEYAPGRGERFPYKNVLFFDRVETTDGRVYERWYHATKGWRIERRPKDWTLYRASKKEDL